MIESALTDENKMHQSINAKILLCSIFDSLSKSRFPSGIKNGDRYKKTVVECTDWCDCERISLLHLVRAFEVSGTIPPAFEPLRKWASDEFVKRFPTTKRLIGCHSPVRKDPLLSEVQKYWPTDKINFLGVKVNVRLEHFQHKHLLWLYRNSLVHEYRTPGRGSERTARLETDPYYQEVSNISELSPDFGMKFTNRWELVYPTGFFLQVARSALSSIAEFHKQKNTSPFAAYSEGTYWIPSLNEE
jgi:hypothetical protein